MSKTNQAINIATSPRSKTAAKNTSTTSPPTRESVTMGFGITFSLVFGLILILCLYKTITAIIKKSNDLLGYSIATIIIIICLSSQIAGVTLYDSYSQDVKKHSEIGSLPSTHILLIPIYMLALTAVIAAFISLFAYISSKITSDNAS